MTQSGGASVGGASFGIGVDLQQWERDLERAEQIARTRAQRIQGVLGAIRISGGAASGVSPSNGVPAAGAAHAVRPPAARQGQGVPAYITTLYEGAIAQGMSHENAVRSISRTLGIPISDLAGLRPPAARLEMLRNRGNEPPGGRIPPRFSPANGIPAPRPRLGPGVGGGGGARPPGGGGPLEFLGLSGSQGILRAAGALTGVGLGLNVAASAASRLHESLAATVEATVQLEQSSRQVGVAFGTGAGQFTGAGAAAFAKNPSTAGTTQQYLQAAASLAPLATQYGITIAQVHQLVVAEGELARLHGVELPQAGQILQSVLRGDLEAGHALGLTLVDQYGRLKSVGLSFDELTQAIGRNRAEQQVISDIQAQAAAQMANDAAQADSTAQALGRLAKAWENLQSSAAQSGRSPVGAVAGATANLLEGKTATGVDVGPASPPLWQLIVDHITGKPSAAAQARAAWLAQQRTAAATPPARPMTDPENPTQAEIDKAIHGAPQIDLENPTQAQLDKVLGAGRSQRTTAATEQANRAGIQSRVAQAQLDTLDAQSDLRRLSVQQQINDLAAKRIEIEGRLAPILIEQQQAQDRIALSTREDLSIKEQVLRAQQAAINPSGAAQDLSYAQQRVRILAQIQQSRAIRGLGPDPNIPDVPTLFGQAYDLALQAPEVDLAALDANQAVAVTQRAQARSQASKQINAIPDEKRLQQIQDMVIPYRQAEAAAKAAADAIERSLQGQDIVAGPARIQAEKDLANAREQQADAAGKIAAAQAEQGGIKATANVNITGLTDVQEATKQILEAFYPVIINAINTAVNNPRPPAGPPTDRGGN
jgi:hypothetical protein